jgi:hypothetical protein
VYSARCAACLLHAGHSGCLRAASMHRQTGMLQSVLSALIALCADTCVDRLSLVLGNREGLLLLPLLRLHTTLPLACQRTAMSATHARCALWPAAAARCVAAPCVCEGRDGMHKRGACGIARTIISFVVFQRVQSNRPVPLAGKGRASLERPHGCSRGGGARSHTHHVTHTSPPPRHGERSGHRSRLTWPTCGAVTPVTPLDTRE